MPTAKKTADSKKTDAEKLAAVERKLATQSSGKKPGKMVASMIKGLLDQGAGVAEMVTLFTFAARASADWFDEHPGHGATGKAILDLANEEAIKAYPFKAKA